MNAIALCDTLKLLEKPICDESILGGNSRLILNLCILILTKYNDNISNIIESFKNGVNVNLKLYNSAFLIGIIYGFLESNDQILLNLIDKIYWASDDNPIELTFAKNLKDNLKSANEDLRKYYTKIDTKYEFINEVEILENQTKSLYRANEYLVITNKSFNYCKISGYISLICAICNDFIRKYKDLDFAEINAINIQNLCFLIGIVFGIKEEQNMTDYIIFKTLNYIFERIKTYFK